MAPVSRILLITSRMLAFMTINLLQLWMMLCVGIFILPLFDLPALHIAGHIGSLCVIGIFASLSAVSAGLLAGSWLKTIEQASALVPVLIVLAAAIGGIMFPLWLMPVAMQKLAMLSPLHWAHQAFVDVLVRDAGIRQLLQPLSECAVFAAVACMLTWWKSHSLD
jgi:ABC-2 type transport system permease protein